MGAHEEPGRQAASGHDSQQDQSIDTGNHHPEHQLVCAIRFPESHAASFALTAYASAYFKVKYLAAFTCAILNNQPMGFYSSAVPVKDAQRHGP